MEKYKYGRWMSTSMAGLKEYLYNCAISKSDARGLLFLIEFLAGKYDGRLAPRSAVIFGPEGIGKTHLFRQMVNASPVPVVYLGTAPIEGRNVIQCSDLKQVL